MSSKCSNNGIRSRYVTLAFLCLGLSYSHLLGQQAVVMPTRTTNLAVGIIASDKPIPVVVNGFLLVRTLSNYDDSSPSVLAYNRDGSLFSQAKLWFPGTVKVSATSATINESGTMAVSASIVGKDGAIAHVIC